MTELLSPPHPASGLGPFAKFWRSLNFAPAASEMIATRDITNRTAAGIVTSADGVGAEKDLIGIKVAYSHIKSRLNLFFRYDRCYVFQP